MEEISGMTTASPHLVGEETVQVRLPLVDKRVGSDTVTPHVVDRGVEEEAIISPIEITDQGTELELEPELEPELKQDPSPPPGVEIEQEALSHEEMEVEVEAEAEAVEIEEAGMVESMGPPQVVAVPPTTADRPGVTATLGRASTAKPKRKKKKGIAPLREESGIPRHRRSRPSTNAKAEASDTLHVPPPVLRTMNLGMHAYVRQGKLAVN
jgi:hypothetical protein